MGQREREREWTDLTETSTIYTEKLQDGPANSGEDGEEPDEHLSIPAEALGNRVGLRPARAVPNAQTRREGPEDHLAYLADGVHEICHATALRELLTPCYLRSGSLITVAALHCLPGPDSSGEK
jgi:hypothetical protein